MYFIKKSLSSVVVLTTFLLTTSAFALEEDSMNEHVTSLVVRSAAYEQCSDNDAPLTLNKTLGNLALVCKKWKNIIDVEMQVGNPSWKVWYGVTPENEHIYTRFLKGTLIYGPNPQNGQGIELKISDLINPLEGMFDLSQCGHTSEFVSISTGYRKEMKLENKGKYEIFLAPRFMIEKKLALFSHHLALQMKKV